MALLIQHVENTKFPVSLINAKNGNPEPSYSLTELIWFGAGLVDAMRGDKKEYATAITIPSTMHVVRAIRRAPSIYAKFAQVGPGKLLLDILERYLLTLLGEDLYAVKWRRQLSGYKSLEGGMLQHLARRVLALRSNFPEAIPALSIFAYALLGLAAEQDSENPRPSRTQCPGCYRTAAAPLKYCVTDHITRTGRRDGTKKRGADENLAVNRRRAPRIKAVARALCEDEQTIYGKLFRQLLGVTGGLNPLPSPLEELQDDEFATGARIGRSGGHWFIYLWEVLPRVRKMLGEEWVDRVQLAMDDHEWAVVIKYLRKIDPAQDPTDAFQWVVTLIRAEAWAEAEEIERQRRRGPGRPRRDPSNPTIKKALVQLAEGKAVKEVANQAGVSTSTVYRWKA